MSLLRHSGPPVSVPSPGIVLAGAALLLALLLLVHARTSLGATPLEQRLEQGETLLLSQRYAEALAVYEQGLRDTRESADTAGEARFLERIARVHSYRHDLDRALAVAEEAIELAKRSHGIDVEADALRIVGNVQRHRSRYAQALATLALSLDRHRAAADRFGEAKTLVEIGIVQGFQPGRMREGLGTLHGARELMQQVGSRRGEAFALHNLAFLQKRRGVRGEAAAAQNYRAALAIWQEIGDRRQAALTLLSIADLDLRRTASPAQYEAREALATLGEALATARGIGDTYTVAKIHQALGAAYRQWGELELATHYQLAALDMHRRLDELESVWRDWKALSDLHRERGDITLAIVFGQQAVATLERIRRNAGDVSGTEGVSYFADKRPVFEDLAAMLLDEGRLLEAERVLALLKAEEFFDYSRRTRAGDSLVSKREDELGADIAAEVSRVAEPRLALLALLRDCLRVDFQLAEARRCNQAREQVKTDFIAYMESLGKLARRGSDADKVALGEKQLDRSTALMGQLDAVRGGVVLQYLVTDEALHILFTSRSAQTATPVAVGRAELEDAVFELRQRLTGEGDEAALKAAAQRLYGWLVAPVAAQLDVARARVLFAQLDGVLRYVPLAALHDGSRWLAERYAVAVYIPGLGNLALAPKLSPTSIAALGVSAGWEDAEDRFPPLPAVRDELEGILDTVGVAAEDRFLRLDGSFTLGALQEAVLTREVVHVASHFSVGRGTEADAYLLLGDQELDDPRYSLPRLRTALDVNRVRLLTLSACNTAVGADASSAAFEGLGTTLLKQGADSIIASLWRVNDRSTAAFMRRLYRVMARLPGNKAKAMQLTQRAFIAAGGPGSEYPAEFAHPNHWAPFIFMGSNL